MTYVLSRKLLGAVTALLAAALMALDTFLLAHSRVLQMDALLATFLTVAWLALLVGLAMRRRRFLIVSGTAMGLACLTKSPALIALPLVVFLVFWQNGQEWRREGLSGRRGDRFGFSRSLIDLAWIGLPAVLAVLLLWPAMWTAPADTLRQVLAFAVGTGQSSHEIGSFWLGKPVEDPGPLFYPAVLLWRSTPVILVGLLLLVASLARGWPGDARGLEDGRAGFPPGRAQWTVRALLMFCLWFGLAMTLGSKKIDRYLLPIFPALTLLAAWGWIAVGSRLWRPGQGLAGPTGNGRRDSAIVLAAGAILIAAQAFGVLANRPSYLTAYNPLLGGIRTASRVMLVGWGEGLPEIARQLNERQDAANDRAAAWYGHAVFGPFYQGRRFDLLYETPTAADLFAHDVDFFVTYINQEQRKLLDEGIRQRLGRPVVTEDWQGVPLATAYAWPKPFGHTIDLPVRPGLRLLGWTVGQHDPSASQLPVTLYWDAAEHAGHPAVDALLAVQLTDQGGETWDDQGLPPLGDDTSIVDGWLGRAALPQEVLLDLPRGLIAGDYGLVLTSPAGANLELGQATIRPSRRTDLSDSQLSPALPILRFGNAFQLLDFTVHETGDAWTLDLLWTALGPPEPGVKFFVHLADQSDAIADQLDATLGAFPGQATATWQQGDLVRHRIHLTKPLAPGTYRLYVGLYRPQSGERLAATADGVPVPDNRYLLKQWDSEGSVLRSAVDQDLGQKDARGVVPEGQDRKLVAG